MNAVNDRSRHEEVWLLLPWLANGRLTGSSRENVEDHVRRCEQCAQELQLQHRICSAFAEPDRVTYAPGPSFRKLMDRIDHEAQDVQSEPVSRLDGSDIARSDMVASDGVESGAIGRGSRRRFGRVSLWRPPGLAWAASFVLLFGLTGMIVTASRWSEPAYRTHTDASVVTPNVLHIAVDRRMPIGEVEELLRTGGARIVEGPGSTGILGITPVGLVAGHTSESQANAELRALSSYLRKDPRVLWVQPLADDQAQQ